MTNLMIKLFIKDENNTIKYRASLGKFAGVVGIICNFLLFVIKLLIGVFSGLVSIIADAFNNLSDASSSVIGILGFKLSEKPADKEHPYGHGRYEYLCALSVNVVIIVIGFELLKKGIDKILNPTPISLNFVMIITLILSILIKLWMMFFNLKIGKKINSKILIATAKDSRNDCIATLSVLLGALISNFSSLALDGYLTALVAIFILISGFKSIKETVDPMLGSAPDSLFIEEINKKISSYDGILGVHDLIVHDYGPCRKFASVHVEMAAEENPITSHNIIDNIENDFLNNEGIHLIIHCDPIITKTELSNDARNYIQGIVKTIDNSLSIHDLRVILGASHTDLIFDCVCDIDFKMSDSELIDCVSCAISEKNPDYNCIITIERSCSPIPKFND